MENNPHETKMRKKEWNKKSWNIVTKRNAMTKERQARQHAHHHNNTKQTCKITRKRWEKIKCYWKQHKTTNKQICFIFTLNLIQFY